jgi:hypothetical protein
VIEFNYQLGEGETPLTASRFTLAPDEFFATDKDLDYTLVAVATTSDDDQPLDLFGWSKLNGKEGKILKGHALNIIQHPEGAYKTIVLRGNRLLELCDQHFLYETDTLRGSSGAPVYSDQWEVVALHHRSVPNIVDGKVMAKAGVPWTEQMPESQIAWIGNEGVRVSSLIKHIKGLALNAEQERLRGELLDADPPNPFVVSRRAMGLGKASHACSLSTRDAHVEVDVTFPVHIRVRLGDLGVSLRER